jgi:sterol desaturase/sphingolipid hydroxylase (fatty acid hydroxylase superfamily)
VKDVVYSLLFFVFAGLAVSLGERSAPLYRGVNWKTNAQLNLTTILFSLSLSGAFLFLADFLFFPLNSMRPHVSNVAPVLLFIIFFIAADFWKFIAHKFMHTRFLWTTHLLHHTPTEMHWLSGNRSSALMLLIHFFPIGILGWYLQMEPQWVLLNSLLNILANHLMHANIKVSDNLSRVLELFLVTPRYHHIHHSMANEHSGKNLGSVLTVWDRLFRTYVNPETVNFQDLKFGESSNAEENIKLAHLIGL